MCFTSVFHPSENRLPAALLCRIKFETTLGPPLKSLLSINGTEIHIVWLIFWQNSPNFFCPFYNLLFYICFNVMKPLYKVYIYIGSTKTPRRVSVIGATKISVVFVDY